MGERKARGIRGDWAQIVGCAIILCSAMLPALRREVSGCRAMTCLTVFPAKLG